MTRRGATGRGRPPCVPCLGAGRREGTPAPPDLGAGQERGSGSAPARGGRALTAGHRMERPSEEEDRLGPIPTFLDSDEESDLVEVSEATAELLTERCTLGLRNDARLKARRRYPASKGAGHEDPAARWLHQE